MPSAPPSVGASVTSVDAALLSQSIGGRERAHEGGGPLSSQETMKPRHVDPESKALFAMWNGKLNFIRYIPIFGEPIECYGPKFVFTLNLLQLLSKGVANTMQTYAFYPIMTERYKCSTLEYQKYYTAAGMGWSIKPFTALVSDAFAVFGYKKRWFLMFSVLLSAVTSVLFVILPPHHSSAMPATVISFLTGYGQANVDILLEGLYSRRMREYPGPGPHLVSLVWAVQMIASIIASCVQGPLSTGGHATTGNVVGGGLMLICLPFIALNWIGEPLNAEERRRDAAILRSERRRGSHQADGAVAATHPHRDRLSPRESLIDSPDLKDKQTAVYVEFRTYEGDELEGRDASFIQGAETDEDEDQVEEEYDIPTCCGGAIEFNREVVVRNYRITTICIIMSAIVVATAFITTFHDGYTLLVTGLVGSFMVAGFMFWALPFVVAKAGLFAFIDRITYLSLNGALNGFYLENRACLGQDYPQFSYFFYNTISGVIGNTAGLLGVVGFAFIFSKQSYRVAFVVTITLEVIASIFDLILVERWNIDIGIPDHVMYIFGDAVVYQVAYMLGWMPLVILMSKLCPRGSEAMVYALLAAFSSYGRSIAGIISTLLMQWAWPVTASKCDFGNLWKLIVLGHLVTPLCAIPFVYLLIPGARICDDIDSDGRVVEAQTRRSFQMVVPLQDDDVTDRCDGSVAAEEAVENGNQRDSHGGSERVNDVEPLFSPRADADE